MSVIHLDRATMKKVYAREEAERLAKLPPPVVAAAPEPVRPLRVLPSQDYVYFIQAATMGLIKIGCAREPMDRLSTLQIGSPDQLTLLAVIQVPGAARADEKWLHRKFAAHRTHGEWFRPHPELMDFVAANAVDYYELLSTNNRDLANEVLSR